ncbi:disease resistance protein RPM1-like [Iris pallida]|nr:disease resistance protein RPM1-like [Iris pallida]
MYAINVIDEGTSSNAVRDRLHNRHVASLFIEEAELVGIDQPREDLIKLLVTAEDKLKVISVVGMGGLGKTTLVRKVYDNEKVKGWFNCHAWITVTQSFTYEVILRSVLTQFYGVRNEPLPERIDTMEGIQLMETLRVFLQDKRYVVVLDDMWHINAWECLKYAFPNNGYGSRILITTRNLDVGISSQETSGCVYNHKPLPPAEAWSLFSKKAFRNIPGGVCPPELKALSENIVKICEGLPLAIVTIGGLLSKKGTFLEWKRLHDGLLHSMLANNPNLQPITRILLLSYNDLPHILKSCFLYFSIFPKDHTVKRITLIRLWISEGFIESEKGETPENVAESYLNDLIDRSMVQVAEHYDHGRVRSCRVHDLIHAIARLKSKEENFSTTLVTRNSQVHERIRRLSIHNNDEDLKDISLSHVRALFIFGANSLLFSSIRNQFHRFRLLKVLDLQGAPIEKFPIEFGKLLHLRYLSLRNTKIRKLSKSIGKLQNLEILDLKGTYVSELPKGILKLRKLRHLLAYHYYTGRLPSFYYSNGVKLPEGIGRLKKLQKLTYLAANEDSNIVKELGNLTKLKRLGVMKLRSKDGANLCSSIEKMKSLLSFSVQSIRTDEILDLKSLSSPPPVLQGLSLRGPLQTLPHWISSLNNLVRMRLRWSRLKEGSLGPLQSLPNLVELTLIHAYDGFKLHCQRGGFKKLQILDLEQLMNLKFVIVEGAMPNLRKMYIRGCLQ